MSVDWQAVVLSLQLALATTAILLVVGTPLAYWLATSTWRGKVVVEAITALPLVLPPTVLGFYVLFAIGPHSPLGQAYRSVTGAPLAFSFEGILIASVLYSLPFTVQPFMAAFARVDRRLIEASRSLGASPLETFFRIVLPLSRAGVVSGMVLTFAHTVGEFGVILMVGGNLPGRTRTASIAIYDHVQALDYAAAGTTSALLLAFSFVVLIVTYSLQSGPGLRS
ncbi:MAG: molybdate ABC transporter permease subunit [Planctomycetes bacterium]|nr:molybdate ABC transporter permease subunit [Planctomycetota bacterium]